MLPQIPLTLTNAIIVTAAVSRQLFPDNSHRVNERNLALTTRLANLLAAPFGGYLMCHGAGGVSGHFRFGARTGTAPLLIGLVFLSLGLLFGEGGYGLLRTIPNAVLGGLLLFSRIDLALSSKPGSSRSRPSDDARWPVAMRQCRTQRSIHRLGWEAHMPLRNTGLSLE